MNERRIKIILKNGFKYQGTEIKTKEGFTGIIDEQDKITREIPNTSISVIEVLE